MFFDISKLIGTHLFYFIVSSRGIGKTFSSLKYCLNNFLKGDKTMKTNIKNYILKYYTGNEKDYSKICSDIYNTFRKELYNSIEDFRYYKNNEFYAFIDWMQGGPCVFDTEYYIRRSAVKDLIFIAGEENVSEYIDEEKAEEAITYLIYGTIKSMIMKG